MTLIASPAMLRFVLISIVLHGLAIGAWHQLGSPAGTTSTGAALSVALVRNPTEDSHIDVQPAASPVETAAVAPTHEQPPVRPRPEHDKAVTATRTVNKEPIPAASATPAPVDPIPASTVISQEAGTSDTVPAAGTISTERTGRLVKQVRDALEAHFRYPRRARRNGWEGTVTLVMQVQPNGQLTDIQVADSSGIPTLDRAALASAQAITRLPQDQDPQAPDHPMQITLPVMYRLMEG